MGHTHYNELANDGCTIFATTRSTGQIEEGPVGFSLMAVDRGVLSWRFKPLDAAWPFVLITSPADRRLITNPDAADQVAHDHSTFARWRGAAKESPPVRAASTTVRGWQCPRHRKLRLGNAVAKRPKGSSA
jgi:hypothetical protein